jgi:translation elongation factor EF-4
VKTKRINSRQFDIPIQAAIGVKVISCEKALRKDVTANAVIFRKRKLLENRKKENA